MHPTRGRDRSPRPPPGAQLLLPSLELAQPCAHGRSCCVVRPPNGSDRTRPSAANLDIATIDREWEAIRRVVGAEGGGVFKRSHTEERRDVRRRPGALAVVSHVPPTAEADECRLVRLADRSADPGIGANHREASDLAPGCERDPVLDVTVVEPTVGAPVALEPCDESEFLGEENTIRIKLLHTRHYIYVLKQ